MSNPAFINPFEGVRKTVDSTDILRLSIDVPKPVVRAIRSVLLDYGSVNIAETLLIKHLYDYILEHELTFHDHDDLVAYICELLKAKPPGNTTKRPAQGGPHQKEGRGDDGRRTRPVHSSSKGA